MTLHDYQLKMINKLAYDIEAWKPSELYVIAGGRQTGKSMLNQLYNANLCKEITLTGQEKLMELTWGQPMKKEKYKFSRAKWHEAEFNAKDYIEVDNWCVRQFGKHPTNPDAWSRWKHKSYEDVIMFRDEKDYVLFMLRWS